MSKANSKKLPDELMSRKQKRELQMLRGTLTLDKKVMESFFEGNVPMGLINKLKLLRENLELRANDLEKKVHGGPPQRRTELKNIKWLLERLGELKSLRYWQFFRVLTKFPQCVQVVMDEDIAKHIRSFSRIEQLEKWIPIQHYIDEKLQLREFFTDCVAFFSIEKNPTQGNVHFEKRRISFRKGDAH